MVLCSQKAPATGRPHLFFPYWTLSAGSGSKEPCLSGSSSGDLIIWPSNLALRFKHNSLKKLNCPVVARYRKAISVHFCKSVALVLRMSRYVGAIPRIFLRLRSCKASILLSMAWVRWIVSSPWKSLDLITASKIKSCHFFNLHL